MGPTTRWGWALMVPLWAWAAAASAQGAFLDVRGSGAVCREFADCEEVNQACFLAAGGMGNCVMRGGQPSCVPPGAIACCGGGDSCDLGFTCTALDTTAPTALSVCLPNEPIFCPNPDGTLLLRQIRDCFSRRDGTYASWALGDCDGDGVSNAAERAAADNNTPARVRMVCSPPLRRGIELGAGCHELPPCEIAGEVCVLSPDGDGLCRVTEDERSLRCQPNDPREELFCSVVGGEQFDCLTADNGIDPPLEAIGAFSNGEFCVPLDCMNEGFTNACITDPDDAVGDPPVPFAEGDCDGDDIENEDEDPGQLCIFNGDDVDAGPDAGVAPTDAGPDAGAADAGLDVDGGRGVDGGPFDAGPGTPNFSGGGGCACRATPGPTDTPLGLWVLASTVLALRSRRRR